MNGTLYGSETGEVRDLLEQVLEEREAIACLTKLDGGEFDVEVEGRVYCIKTPELIGVYIRRIDELKDQLAKYGVLVAEESARPKPVAAKKPIDMSNDRGDLGVNSPITTRYTGETK